jgi:hypothetical protein
MATVIAPPEPPREDAPQADAPQQGVIEDARRRQRRRRASVSVSVALAAVAVAGGLIALGASRGGSHRSAAQLQAPRAGAPVRLREPRRGDVRLTPALPGGSVGWCVAYDRGETCAALPTPRNPIFDGEAGYTPQAGWDTVELTTPGVAAVAFDHVNVRTRDISLPYGLRVAYLHTSATPKQAADITSIARRGMVLPPMTHSLTPLDARGHRMTQHLPRGGDLPATFWRRPAHAPPGPCRITATPMRGLSPQWGNVARRLRSFNDVVGRAFQSCADTEFYLHNWPLDTAILLDAGQPGRPPAPLPNMTPVAGAPGVFSAPGGFPEQDMTARRLPNAWLVVQGGSGPVQRLTVLRHLHANLSLH